MNLILFIYLELNPPPPPPLSCTWESLVSSFHSEDAWIEISPDPEHVSDVKSWDVVMSDVRKSLKTWDIILEMHRFLHPSAG